MKQTTFKDECGQTLEVGDRFTTIEFSGCPLNEEVVEWEVRQINVMMAVPVEPLYDVEIEMVKMADQETIENGCIIGFRKKPA